MQTCTDILFPHESPKQVKTGRGIRGQQRLSNNGRALEQLGSRHMLQETYRLEMINDGEAWMLMVQDRNLASHTYSRSTVDAISQNVSAMYLTCMQALRKRLKQRQLEEQG